MKIQMKKQNKINYLYWSILVFLMGKCPYCSKELHIEDFFIIKQRETKRGKIKTTAKEFKGESIEPPGFGAVSCKMWACPSCDAILGFTEVGWDSN